MLTYMYVFKDGDLVWIISSYAFPEKDYIACPRIIQFHKILCVGWKSSRLSSVNISMSIVFVQLMAMQLFCDFFINSAESVHYVDGVDM